MANTELRNKQDLPTVCRSLLFVQATLFFFYLFFCEANSKAHKVEQVFPYAACNNHSFVVLFEADVAVWKSSIVRVDA